ncbi:hypothetical protein WG908_07900 [Sphingobium sp. AN641]
MAPVIVLGLSAWKPAAGLEAAANRLAGGAEQEAYIDAISISATHE